MNDEAWVKPVVVVRCMIACSMVEVYNKVVHCQGLFSLFLRVAEWREKGGATPEPAGARGNRGGVAWGVCAGP